MTEVYEMLKAYLAEAEDAPMIWGENDCSTWPAKWVERVRGVSVPLPAWFSREEAHALMRKAGSLVALWDEALSECGIYETAVAGIGDVGVILSHAHGEAGGIFLDGGYFAWRAEPKGYRILRPRQNTIVKVWSIQ
ncbi:hypothetical protein EDE05_12815 [Neorhizobium sp. R1-B]|uniref:DUF6950 family protein n=1 Tax=Neorhizobium sp. R1-B TaxID=2485162 RepID=UPI001065CBF3|nr:hypothetical protein [Neorhizobium sp. R1-B]TDX72594.1 hypothetical protein EDE05_12815 [Neorhizobium sp. R1-B]